LGPSAQAIPQCGIGDCGSSSAARWNERTASSWLNANTHEKPWSKKSCASSLLVAIG
jgi:hypothetical protein